MRRQASSAKDARVLFPPNTRRSRTAHATRCPLSSQNAALARFVQCSRIPSAAPLQPRTHYTCNHNLPPSYKYVLTNVLKAPAQPTCLLSEPTPRAEALQGPSILQEKRLSTTLYRQGAVDTTIAALPLYMYSRNLAEYSTVYSEFRAPRPAYACLIEVVKRPPVHAEQASSMTVIRIP